MLKRCFPVTAPTPNEEYLVQKKLILCEGFFFQKKLILCEGFFLSPNFRAVLQGGQLRMHISPLSLTISFLGWDSKQRLIGIITFGLLSRYLRPSRNSVLKVA